MRTSAKKKRIALQKKRIALQRQRIALQGILKDTFLRFVANNYSSDVIDSVKYLLGTISDMKVVAFIGYRERGYSGRYNRKEEIAFSELVLFNLEFDPYTAREKNNEIIGKITCNQGIIDCNFPMDRKDARYLGTPEAGIFVRIITEVNRSIRRKGGPL